MGALEYADLRGAPPFPLLAEQFQVEALRRHAGGTDGDELASRPGTGAVDEPRHQFLPRSRRSRDQHAAVGGGNPGDQLTQLLRGRGPADEAVRGDRLGPQPAILPAQLRGLQGALHQQQQAVGLERLLEEVIGPALDGRYCGLDVPVTGNHDHRQFGIEGLHHVQQFEPVETAPLHPDVLDEQRRTALPQCGEGLMGVRRGPDEVALVLQDPGHKVPDVLFVINNQNISRHGIACPVTRADRRGPAGRSAVRMENAVEPGHRGAPRHRSAPVHRHVPRGSA